MTNTDRILQTIRDRYDDPSAVQFYQIFDIVGEVLELDYVFEHAEIERIAQRIDVLL